MQMEASTDEEDAITLEIMSDIQLILSALCETDMHRKVHIMTLIASTVCKYQSSTHMKCSVLLYFI